MLQLIPNGITFSRIILGLAFPWTPAEWRPWVIVIGAVSDGLDGLAARGLGLTSETGRLLDPIADKVFVLMLAGTLIGEGTIHPAWAAGVAARDLIVLGATAVVALRGRWGDFREMRPSILGKATTALQFAVLLAAIVWGESPLWLLAVTTIVSLVAGVQYVVGFGQTAGPDKK